ncbi:MULTISPECIES: hypothetical protein [Chelativorans]|jgi:hypothetical protein|uniref:Uncharacterized protein n=1 Tax=Chelativorans sp. (strain BNC1) TaxID=266779 RepID=Q11H41_CHESB|nr:MULTISPECIES: hypothetical protein [Chelativorans]
MTPAERARKIEQEEFAAECRAARARALAYSKECRQLEAAKVEAWMRDRWENPATVRFNTIRCFERSKFYTFDGKALTLTQWAAETGIPLQTLRYRIDKGWHLQRALTEPVMNRAQRAKLHRRNVEIIRNMVQHFRKAQRTPCHSTRDQREEHTCSS